MPAAQLVAIADPSRQTLDETGDIFGVGTRFESFERALEDAEFDAVVITTPTFTHAELAVAAANAGKHVLLEKQMAMTLEECDTIISATERNGVVLQLAFMRRFDPEFVAAAECIEAGDIGRPMLVKSLTHGPGLPPPGHAISRPPMATWLK